MGSLLATGSWLLAYRGEHGSSPAVFCQRRFAGRQMQLRQLGCDWQNDSQSSEREPPQHDGVLNWLKQIMMNP
jgi:hypothetical protein